jgi:hypothetical protein
MTTPTRDELRSKPELGPTQEHAQGRDGTGTGRRGPEQATSAAERDGEHSFTSGPKRDPAAPGASNNGDASPATADAGGRRMFAGETPPEAESDTRTERQKHEEWPTVGVRPGSENMSQEVGRSGLRPDVPPGEPVRESGRSGLRPDNKKTS